MKFYLDTAALIRLLYSNCDSIVTYDSHFQTVTTVIDVLTPPQALGRLSTL